MTELECRLRQYGEGLTYPAGDQWPGIASRIERTPQPRVRLSLVLVAAAVVAMAVAFAVPPARSAILELLGFDGVEIVRVDDLAPLAPATGADFGARASLDQARRAVPFWLLVPEGKEPSEVYLGADDPPAVTLVWGTPTHPRLLLTQFRPAPGVTLRKEVPRAAETVEFALDGDPAIWVPGGHTVQTATGARSAGPTLLWEHGAVVYRLEADLDRNEALALARSLIPIAG
jgi:hypothetical protein